MKRTFLCLLVAFVAASHCALGAQTGETEITTSGTGSVSLPPNVATVNAALDTSADRADDAVAQNNRVYDRIVGALEQLGIARSDIALASYYVSYNPPPSPAQPAGSTGERYGYTVSRSFTVKVGEIGKAGTVSDACLGAGATSINGVSFGLADPSGARAQAIAKAVADARASAQALARTAGLRILSIKSIELGPSGVGPQPLMARAAAPTAFDQSNVNVTLSVTAVFLAAP
jgi:uncharacterized protein YggE